PHLTSHTTTLAVLHSPTTRVTSSLDAVSPQHDTFRRRAPVFHPEHDDPVGRPQIELAGDLRRHRTHLEPQHRARAAAAGALLLGLTLVRRLADLDLDDLLGLVAQDLQLGRAVGSEEANGAL